MPPPYHAAPTRLYISVNSSSHPHNLEMTVMSAQVARTIDLSNSLNKSKTAAKAYGYISLTVDHTGSPQEEREEVQVTHPAEAGPAAHLDTPNNH